MKKSQRQTATLPESVLQRLNAYAIAAGAAGVGVLAALPAEGEVVYTPVEVKVSLAGPTYYFLNPAASPVAPFLFYAGFTSPNIYWDELSFNPYTSGARFVQGPGTAWSIAPLKRGMAIGASRKFGSRYRGFAATYGPYGGGTYNNHKGFKFGQVTYIGFKFLIDGQTHYGWARITVRFNHKTPKRRLYGELTGYAYETIPNQSIRAGQTSGTFSDETLDVPQSKLDDPSTTTAPGEPDHFLGLLALGTAGLPAWRPDE